MHELSRPEQSTLCLGIIILLCTLAVLPARGQELPDDILEVSRQMVERERAGDYSSALLLAQKALSIAEETMGPETVEVAIYSDYLGMIHLKAGHEQTAKELLLKALSIREHLLGANHMAVASTLRHLAEIYRQSGEAEKAVTVLRRALAIDEKAFGTDHMGLTPTLQSISLIYLDEGRYAEGEPFIQRALDIQEHIGGTVHPKMAAMLEYYVKRLRETGRLDQALQVETRINRIQSAGQR